MPSHEYHPGDLLACTAFIYNTESTPLDGFPLFVVFMAKGELFCYPSFAESVE
jgi:hypothetical protein